MKLVLVIVISVSAFAFSVIQEKSKSNDWKAPESANNVINPIKADDYSIAEGKKLFVKVCSVCHGDKGKGDGIGGISLVPKPGNFTLGKTQGQTDGALFWKISEGRPPMASYKSLSITQRWQLVNYLRKFKK